MKKINKFLCLTLGLFMGLFTSVGCNNGKGESDSSSSEETSVDDGIGEVKGTLIENGEPDYVIVTSATPSETGTSST